MSKVLPITSGQSGRPNESESRNSLVIRMLRKIKQDIRQEVFGLVFVLSPSEERVSPEQV